MSPDLIRSYIILLKHDKVDKVIELLIDLLNKQGE